MAVMTLSDITEHVQLQAALMCLAEDQLILLSSILPQVGCGANLKHVMPSGACRC